MAEEIKKNEEVTEYADATAIDFGDDEEKIEYPSIEQLESELKKEKRKTVGGGLLRVLIYLLVIATAASLILCAFVFPITDVTGRSMENALHDGDKALTVSKKEYKTGDVIAFNYGDKVLFKRVIAIGGQTVDIDESGNIYIDGTSLKEPYISVKSIGSCDIPLPYKVPEGKVFVLGDKRMASIDSRHKVMGCIDTEDIIGKLFFVIWPFEDIGIIK